MHTSGLAQAWKSGTGDLTWQREYGDGVVDPSNSANDTNTYIRIGSNSTNTTDKMY